LPHERPPGGVGTVVCCEAVTRSGNYEMLFELARGGMGTIELGRTVGVAGVRRLVAVKRIHGHLSGSTEAIARFLDEARVAARVNHANVLALHRAARDERGLYVIFEYIEGESLDGLVDRAELRHERVPPSIVVRVVLDALAGLHAAHEAKDASGKSLGILHRDVSMQNILVGRDGVARLADFGISKSALHSVATEIGTLVGKVSYMPPEYLRHEPVDRRMDVYAMGVTLLSALAGHDPWQGASEAQVVSMVLTQGVPVSSALGGIEVAKEIEEVVARACHQDAARRHATARDMLDELERHARRSRCIASPVEVAEYVEKLAGGFLDARRQAIAESIESLEKVHISTTPPPRVNIVMPARSRLRVAAVVVSAATCSAGALFALARIHDSDRTSIDPPASDTSWSTASATVSASSPPPAAPATSAITGRRVVAPFESTNPITTPSARPQSVGPAQARSQAARSTVQARPQSAAPRESGTPVKPGGISTANPYR